MLFNSLEYAIFFPIVLVFAWALRRHSGLRLTFLLVASYLFYMSWNWRYAGLLAGSTLLDYGVGLGLVRWRGVGVRRLLLTASLVGNLGVLAAFKYFNFFAASASTAAGWFGLSMSPVMLHVLLPVGISFYTFQSLSYTIDVYRGTLAPTRSLIRFALFVSFFPQLVAGPIVRASEFMPQLAETPKFVDRNAQRGLYLIFIGLIKKVCIADVLAATLVDRVISAPHAAGSLEALLATYGFAFQIFCDFSGYSDVAIGSAALLGYRLPMNFDRPYAAVSIRDFWRRWHISLSTWLRDYLYIPLGGNKRSPRRTYANLMIVMLLGGLWHGANWTFVVWGAIHGGLLAIERLTGWDAGKAQRMGAFERWGRRLLTFHLAAGAFLIFRCATFGDAVAVFSRIVALDATALHVPVLFWAALAAGILTQVSPGRLVAALEERILRQPAFVQAGLASACIVLLTALSVPHAPFIYFQF